MTTPLPAPHERNAAEEHEARLQFLTWDRTAADIASPEQVAHKQYLAITAGASFAPTAYVAREAAIFTTRLLLGENSWIAGHALVRGDVELGANCTVNPYACISGRVRCGDGVRIASLASIVGFNHGFEDPSQPIHKQKHQSRGIVIEDDVWIGANALIVDGVTIGKGAVVAGGSVVSKDVPSMAIVAGVPARVMRMRGQRMSEGERPAVEDALAQLGEAASAQWPHILAAHRIDGEYLSRDDSGERRASIRHLCDAIEIATSFGGLPEGLDVPATIARLQALQDEATGLIPDPYRKPDPARPLREDGLALYNVLAVGYALECLGAHPAAPISLVEDLDPNAFCTWLENLPWGTRAWSAGAAIDAIGTAFYFNARYFKSGRNRETLFGWLSLQVNRATGLWGKPTEAQGLLQPVNGFYRLTRGSYAQFGIPLPHAERAIDTVLLNYRNYGGFSGPTYTACNLLDTIHPLRLCLLQTDHRRAEAEDIARAIITRAAERWMPGEGFAFADGQLPSLQGTEMWLSVVHIAADLLGLAGDFPFVSRGVHRLKPVGLGL